jgi:hypothetical protein
MRIMHKLLTSAVLTVALLALVPSEAKAVRLLPWRDAAYAPAVYDWHAGYVDPQWAAPHAMVVPPNVSRQIKYSWGVGGTEQHRIRPVYQGVYGVGSGGYGAYGGLYRPAPVQPSHTDQLGTYYIRMPRH